MRTLFSALCAIVAIVLTPVALSAAWLDENVVSVEGFLELAGPLGENKEFQSSLADALGEQLGSQSGLPPELNALVEPLITETAQQVTTLPGYKDAWNESLRQSHAMIFSAGEGAKGEPGLTLEIGPIVSLAVTSFSDTTGFEVKAPESVPVDVGTNRERQVVDQLQRVAGVWIPLAVVAAVAAIAALLIARVRSTTLAFLGLGAVLTGIVLWLLAENYRTLLPEQAGGSEIARLFRDSLLSRGADDFAQWAVYLVGTGGAVLLIGILWRLFSGGRRRTS